MEGRASDLAGGRAYGLSEVLGQADPMVLHGWYGAEVAGVTENVCQVAYEGYPYVADVGNLDVEATGALVEALL